MHLRLDEYAYLDSPVHRWNPRSKFLALFVVIVAFSFVQTLALVPLMVALTAIIYLISRLPLRVLLRRLRYPGLFLLALVVMLPLVSGPTVLLNVGPLAIRQEGTEYMLLVVSRFTAIMTITVVMFSTSPFITNVYTLRRIGLPTIMVDMLMLTVRYIFEVGDTLSRMQRAMRLRGFAPRGLNRQSAGQWAALIGTLLLRSHAQSQRVYNAMRLRGYNASSSTFLQAEASSMTNTVRSPALDIEGVYFAYPNRPPALKDVSLTVQPGERVGVIGPNGAGKSSLFLAICGVLQPSQGTVLVFDESVHIRNFNPDIGLVFQNADDQLFSPSVREDIAFGPVNMGLDKEEVAHRVAEAARLTGTQHLLDRVPHHLSGGEKRMVAIATVLAMQPRLVLYDEPDTNLDMRSRRRLIRFLQAAAHTVLVASHDLELILEVCERVLIVDEGRIVADGPPARLMANEALMEAHGLEKPYSLIA
jgi:cobalt/nickel transport system ATP-binding protein